MEAKTSHKWQVKVDLSWCKACRLCIENCPKDVFTSNSEGKAVVSDIDSCIGCHVCDQLCPDLAIEVSENE